MSVPRLALCGLEPGPGVALAAGALLAVCADDCAVRPVLLGADLPLWRLLHDSSALSPRVLDPRLMDDATAGELYDVWAADTDLVVIVAVEPALDRWEGVEGSRPVDVAAALDTPMVLVVDARDRGATAAAAACGTRLLARGTEFAGVIVVGADEHGAAADLRGILEDAADLPVLGWLPPLLSEQFARQYGGARGSLRRIGPRPVRGGTAALCREAAGFIDREVLLAVAARRGFLPARPRRVLAASPAAADLKLAVGWGAPLVPFAFESIDLLKAQGLALEPLRLTEDDALPEGVSGLLLTGSLDEDHLGAFAANAPLKTAIAAAVDDGLPTLTFGGGALLLLSRLTDSRGHSHELAGVLPAEAELVEWYERPRYISAVATRENPYVEGTATLYELFDLEYLTLRQEEFAFRVGDGDEDGRVEGLVHERCLATTLVPSLPAVPGLAAGFIAAMRSRTPGV